MVGCPPPIPSTGNFQHQRLDVLPPRLPESAEASYIVFFPISSHFLRGSNGCSNGCSNGSDATNAILCWIFFVIFMALGKPPSLAMSCMLLGFYYSQVHGCQSCPRFPAVCYIFRDGLGKLHNMNCSGIIKRLL